MRMSKKLVFVIPSLNRGGAQAHVIRDANGLSRLGYRVSVVVINGEQEMAGELDSDIPVHCLQGRTSSVHTWLRFIAMVRQLEPDLLIGWSTYASLIVGLAQLTGAARKTLLVENNFPPLAHQRMPRLRRLVVKGLSKFFYGRANTIAANSDGIIRYLKAWVGENHRFARLRNPVDFARFRSLSEGALPVADAASGDAVIVMASRMWRHQKGIDVLLLAARRLLAHPRPWRLWMLGDGGDLSDLKLMARDLGVSERVSWFGMQDNPFPFYKRADIVVLPSRYEGFPNTVLEAMAVGKAVVCADCQTGPRELTCNGQYGLLVPVGDDGALAEALGQLISDPDRRSALGARAAQHIASAHAEDIVFAELISVIEQAAA
jgi:glycosyltransferase involved in cell wall biosynthesis